MPVLAADIHGKLSVYECLVDQTSSVEVLVLPGDRFDADFEDQQRLQVAEILQILHPSRAVVLYIMGNDGNTCECTNDAGDACTVVRKPRSVRFGNVSSRGLADCLQSKPVLAHIHGHIHHRSGVDEYHFNVASAAICRTLLIDLPSLSYEVLERIAR
jgi:Icc-related predicted phosphoesterase